MTNAVGQCLKGWIPRKLSPSPDGALVQWLFTGTEPYVQPFFDETISRCLSLPENSHPFKCVSTAEMMVAWPGGFEAVAPAAFIFHVSRCGSTLVSQALGGSDANISLSEVPFFDELLRTPYQDNVAMDVPACLRAALCFYGQQRTGTEQRLFVKTDSWHLLFYDTLRQCFPPCALHRSLPPAR